MLYRWRPLRCRSAAIKRKPITLSNNELEKFTGSYTAKDGAVFLVTRINGRLLLATGDKTFLLYPSEKKSFFVKEEDLTFSFTRTNTLKAQAIVVRENGRIVEEATRISGQ